MFRKEKKQDDGYDAYRASAKGYFRMAEKCMRAQVSETFNGYNDTTTALKAQKQEEVLLHYASAIENLLRVPEASRRTKDNDNLSNYFKSYGQAHMELGYSQLGFVIKAQGQEYKKHIEQISESSEIEESVAETTGQKRKLDEARLGKPVEARSIFRPEKKARKDDDVIIKPAPGK